MGMYKKRPVTVEALRITDAASAYEIAQWVNNGGGQAIFDSVVFANGGGILINTSEGSMVARTGWWVVKGTRGEFYPCRPDVFRDAYAEVKPK